MSAIFRITSLADWEAALATGAVPRCAADTRDDCIHVNAADDVERVASAFFSADERPVALELDRLALAQYLIWLPPSQAKPWPQGRVALPNILTSHVLGIHELLHMPETAIASGFVDFVLSPEEIAEAIIDIANDKAR